MQMPPFTDMHPHPLLLSQVLLSKVWGGDRLSRFGKDVNLGSQVGESWELADLPSTSSSGAGGGAVVSTIILGPLEGKTIRDAMELWGADMLGRSAPAGIVPGTTPRFPLLVKYLDARENLSVQVHPSIAYTREHPGASLKTECWYILEADPGAVIYKGVKPGVTREVFEKHLRMGDGSAVVDDLVSIPARVGDMHNLPSGTVHALGAGVLVAEVQTPSDTTFRVYDWGRVGRELHIEQALECIHFGPARDATRLAPGETSGQLVSTGFFTVDELNVRGSRKLLDDGDTGGRPIVMMVIKGECVIDSPSGGFGVMLLPLGSTVLVPASIAATCRIEGKCRLLRVTVMGGA